MQLLELLFKITLKSCNSSEIWKYLTYSCTVCDPYFIARLALLIDVFEHVNKLNTELQGREKWVFDLQSAIKAFVSKLQILREEVEGNSYSHFNHHMEFTATIDIDYNEELDLIEEKQDLLEYLQNLTENVNARFPDLMTEALDFAKFPFKSFWSSILINGVH